MFPPSPTIRVGFVAVLLEELLTESGWLQMGLGFRWRRIPCSGLECILPACHGATSINVLPQIVQEILCGLFLVGQLVPAIEGLCSCRGGEGRGKKWLMLQKVCGIHCARFVIDLLFLRLCSICDCALFAIGLHYLRFDCSIWAHNHRKCTMIIIKV